MSKLELGALLEAYREWMKEELPTLSQHCRHMIYGVEAMLEDCLALADNPFLKEAKVAKGLKQIPASQMDPGAPGGSFTAYQEIPASGVNHRVLNPLEVEVLRRQQEVMGLFFREAAVKIAVRIEELMGLEAGTVTVTPEASAAPLPLFSQEVPTEGVEGEEDSPAPDVVIER